MSRDTCISIVSHSTGRRYFELELVSYPSGAHFPELTLWGVTRSTPPAVDEDPAGAGVCVAANGIGYSQGMYVANLGFGTLEQGDVLMFLMDLDETECLLWVGLNGTWLTDLEGPPMNEIQPADPGTYYVVNAVARAGDGSLSIRLKTTAAQIDFALPAGALPWEN